jgi:ATP-dependent RNA helicase SUPV3L1/SUV3
VQRRLQHFIDRKVAALFEPLLNLKNDEALTGLARGFAFRMVEAMGVLPRAEIADEVKALDQDARGALRKHGLRFGQFTIFMPLLLKPAPTRLRLVLWSLANGMDEFPEAPPPGLVTVPNSAGTPAVHHTISGYRAAGARAIRIDMLERLADMLRAEDSRGGFEAKADMLSITGMTLEQFADLMQGLGYNAVKGERPKVKPADAVVPGAKAAETPAADTPVMDVAENAAAGTAGEAPQDAAADVAAQVDAVADEGVAPVAETPIDPTAKPEETSAIAEVAATEVPTGTAADAAVDAPEAEVFYTFTWGRKRENSRGQNPRREGGGRNAKPKSAEGGNTGGRGGQGKPRGKGGPNKGKPRRDEGAKTYQSRPEKKDRIDPDNPFAAALMGLKDKK